MKRSGISWRTPALLIYCGLLLIGSLYLAEQSKSANPRFKAAHPMAVNHVVQTGDVEAVSGEAGSGEADPAKLKGLFAKTAIRQGEIVRASDFGPVPLLRAPGRVTIELPFGGTLGNVNAGDPLALCKRAEDLKVTTPAVALMCDGDGAQRKNCAAIVQLRPEDARTILDTVSVAVAKPAAQGCTQETQGNRTARPPRG